MQVNLSDRSFTRIYEPKSDALYFDFDMSVWAGTKALVASSGLALAAVCSADSPNILGPRTVHRVLLDCESCPIKSTPFPPKRPETETPTVVEEHGERHPSAEEKMQRSADRLGHKAARTQQNDEEVNKEFSNIGRTKVLVRTRR